MGGGGEERGRNKEIVSCFKIFQLLFFELRVSCLKLNTKPVEMATVRETTFIRNTKILPA